MKRKATDTKNPKVIWTEDEDGELMKAVLAAQTSREQENENDNDSDEEEDWDAIADTLSGNKTAVQCYKRYRALQNKAVLSPTAAAPKDDDGASKDDDTSQDSSSQAKRPKTDESGWNTQEIDLLKKLAEEYTKRNGMLLCGTLREEIEFLSHQCCVSTSSTNLE
jgi:Myb-like DNA-binding domain